MGLSVTFTEEGSSWSMNYDQSMDEVQDYCGGAGSPWNLLSDITKFPTMTLEI